MQMEPEVAECPHGASQAGADVCSIQAPALPRLDPDAPEADALCPAAGHRCAQRGLPFPAPRQLELGQMPGFILQII